MSQKKHHSIYFKLLILLIPALVIGAILITNHKKKGVKKTNENTLISTKLPKDYPIQGIDISHHQGEINWDKVQKSKLHGHPIAFAIIKATEGGDFKDHRFKHNWKELSKVGLTRGAYHFFRPKTNPKIQADNFIKNVTLKKGDLPPVVDVEVMDGVSSEQLRKNLKTFINQIENHYKVKPIIYSSPEFYGKILKNEFSTYPFWISHLSEKGIALTVFKWKFWQYSDKGKIDGIKGSIDVNTFNGNLNDFYLTTIQN
jgi:lysozyme